MHITVKGQITIPLKLREKYGITPETEIEFHEEKDHIIIKMVPSTCPESRFQKMRGVATVGMSTEEILSLTREDS